LLHLSSPREIITLNYANKDPTPREFLLRSWAIELFNLRMPSATNAINFLLKDECGRQSLGLVALTVANTFHLLYSADGSAVSSFLISHFLLFDQATIDLIELDTGFAFQLLLCQFCLIASQAVMNHGLASAAGTVHCIIALSTLAVSAFIRYEVWPAGIPVLIAIVVDLFRDSSSSFLRRVERFIGQTLSLAFVSGCLVALAIVLLTLGGPNFEYGGMSIAEFLVELTVNPHNVVLFAFTPIAFGFWLLSRIPNVWPWGLFLAAAVTLFQPIGCLVNDWMMRAVLARYFILVGSASVICTGAASVLSVPVVLAMIPIALYFYVNPIQQ
jgi:hypothetical protein